jgi:hypothetical protein
MCNYDDDVSPFLFVGRTTASIKILNAKRARTKMAACAVSRLSYKGHGDSEKSRCGYARGLLKGATIKRSIEDRGPAGSYRTHVFPGKTDCRMGRCGFFFFGGVASFERFRALED